MAARLAVLADVAEATRQSAMQSGDSAILLRAIDPERALVGDLLRILGHDAEAVRAELAEAEAIADAVAETVRHDPSIGLALVAELELAGSTAASDLASAFRDLMARPRPPLAAIAVRD